MATGHDAAAVLGTILSIGSAIRDSIDTGYMVSEKSEDFTQKLKQLGREQAFWEAQILKYGLSWDRDLLKIFIDAKTQLKDQKEGLTREINSRGLAKLKRALLPSPVEQIITTVGKIFQNVLHELKRRTDIGGGLKRRALFKVPLLGFKKDNRYVRLHNTNKEVIGALGNADGPPIVLLHGSPGTGKSSLARDVALQAQETINRSHSQQEGPPQSSVLAGMSGLSIATDYPTELWTTGSLFFEQVIFLECGSSADLQTKQKELRDALGWGPVSPEARESGYESDKTLTTVLAGLLKEKPLLIILDDVWKSTFDTPEGQPRKSHFLQKMTDLGGNNVKWLVTSQEGDLCSVVNRKCKAVAMEHIEPEVARRILALQIGFPVDEIRGGAKMYMDKIIQMIDANPLAMTCISPAIERTRFDDEREWEVAMEELAILLGTTGATAFHSKKYREAIKVGFDLLTKQNQNLLILIALCKGPSVPEEIIEYLFVQSKDTNSYQNFSSARRDLERRQLVRIFVSTDRIGKEGKRWVLHDMMKEFILQSFSSEDDTAPLIQRLFNKGIMFKFDSELESQVMSSLIALYFNKRLRNEFEQFNSLKMDNVTITRRGEVIEPISRLLILRENERWTSTLHLSIRQVFLTYVRDGQFDEASTLNVLDSNQYALHMVAALDNFAWSRDYSFVGEKVICALVRLLENATALDFSKEQQLDYDLLTGVSGAVSRLVLFSEYEHTSSVKFLEGVSFSKAFAQLATLLINETDEDHTRTQEQAVLVIKNLVVSHSIIELELIYTPGLLEGLIKASFRSDNHDLQATVVVIFATLACRNEGAQMRLVDVPGMLDGLVKALTATDHHRLQSEASGLLSHLSLNDDTALKIVEYLGALDELVNGIGRDTNRLHQERCAQAFGHLASRGGNVTSRLLQFPKLVGGLVKASFKDDNRDLQATVVEVLDTLAHQNDSFGLQMVDAPGLLDALVKAFAVDDHHRLQRTASGLLLYLSLNDHTALKIVECPGALLELVNGLGKDTNKRHQICCASALGRLASLGDGTRLKLLQVPKITQELAGALMNDGVDESTLRLAAGLAVAQLAVGNHHIKSEMRNSAGLLETLMHAVSKDNNNGWAIYGLTVLSPQRGMEIHLSSVDAYSRRGEAEAHLGLYKEALEDLDESCRLGGSTYNTFSTRCYVKARLSNFQEALVDANCAVQNDSICPCALMDRGVVKRMLGDLRGALEDLDQSFAFCCHDDPRDKYAILKHRGFVKYLSGDEEGARADAESAITCRPVAVDDPTYGTETMGEGWSVEYLNFQLR